ncbi:MAG: hypothetical protein CSA75_02675 [Sorangium cellulosum]|nr:MAG: hypothetical protein CSA75_02675 [Sorangium cellulosum]
MIGKRREVQLAKVGVLLAVAFASPTAMADPEPAASFPAASAIPLPTIPRPVEVKLKAPEPDATKELEQLVTQLASVDPKQSEKAAVALAEQDESMLSAIAQKLIDLRKSADREGMERLLEAARKAAREDLKRTQSDDDAKSKNRTEGGNSLAAESHELIDPSTTDWLKYVMQDPSPAKKPYKDLVAVLALSRTCVAIGTTAAAREIINVYMYFGDLFRVDVQRQLTRMKQRALPALIEAQYHDSRMVRTWAKKRLDLMGRAIPSEAVRLNDNQALADVLRAYGRAREVEAVRVIVSFANSDRLQVREAAREAIGQVGEPARWQLRDAYEQLMGEKPARSWDWRRTARELFSVYDRARLQEVYATMDAGLKQAEAGNTAEAVKLFDRVLARAPMFERRNEMVASYLAYAKKVRDEDRIAASASLRRALAIAPEGERSDAVRSEIALLEAKHLAERGVLDVSLLDQAIKLNPSNQEAKKMREAAKHEVQVRESTWRRYAAAVAIGVIAMAAMVFVALVPRRKKLVESESPPKLRPPTPDVPPRG